MSAIERNTWRPLGLDPSAVETEVRVRLGTILLRNGALTPEQLEEALTSMSRTGERLGETLVRLGWLTERDVAQALAEQYGLDYIDLRLARPESSALALLPAITAAALSALPVRLLGNGRVLVAVSDPTDIVALDRLCCEIPGAVALAVAERSAIRDHLDAVLRTRNDHGFGEHAPGSDPGTCPAP
jgi:hypothetical protein